jgi:hypothetical protein
MNCRNGLSKYNFELVENVENNIFVLVWVLMAGGIAALSTTAIALLSIDECILK